MKKNIFGVDTGVSTVHSPYRLFFQARHPGKYGVKDSEVSSLSTSTSTSTPEPENRFMAPESLSSPDLLTDASSVSSTPTNVESALSRKQQLLEMPAGSMSMDDLLELVGVSNKQPEEELSFEQSLEATSFNPVRPATPFQL